MLCYLLVSSLLSLAHFPPFVIYSSLFLHHSFLLSSTTHSSIFSTFLPFFLPYLSSLTHPFHPLFLSLTHPYSLLLSPPSFLPPFLPCIALEFAERGLLTKIYPVMIGDKTIEETEGEPTVCYTNYFASGCHPSACKDVVVDAVEQRTSAHLDRQVMLCTSSYTLICHKT